MKRTNFAWREMGWFYQTRDKGTSSLKNKICIALYRPAGMEIFSIPFFEKKIWSPRPSMDQPVRNIASGTLEHRSGRKVDYTISNGWDPESSVLCDREWSQATAELLTHILDQNFDEARLHQVLESLSTEDSHWTWTMKAFALRSREYEWFHLFAEGKPQGACVIFHPKKSALSESDIFYVEFIAVAPWNRKNLIRDRAFRGVGRALLAAALKFSRDQLKLAPGFCLHSLPGAVQFYMGLQMKAVPAKDKDSLRYFELPAPYAEELMKVA